MTSVGRLTSDQRDWLRVRSYLLKQRYDLALEAADEYPAGSKIAGTPLLAVPGWQPSAPVPIQDISLEFSTPPVAAFRGDGAAPVLPARPDGTRYLR
jgi:hypothetical protein